MNNKRKISSCLCLFCLLVNISFAADDPLEDDYYEVEGSLGEVKSYLRTIINKFDEGLDQASSLSEQLTSVKDNQVALQKEAMKAEYDRRLLHIEQETLKKRTKLLEERGEEQSKINRLLSDGMRESLRFARNASGWAKFMLGIAGTVIAGFIQRKYFGKKKKKV